MDHRKTDFIFIDSPDNFWRCGESLKIITVAEKTCYIKEITALGCDFLNAQIGKNDRMISGIFIFLQADGIGIL